MNLDLNLGPIPEPEDALSGGSVSLEDFIGEVNGRRERLRRRDFQTRWHSNDVDSLREEGLRQREMRPLERSDSFDQLGERLRPQEIQSPERPQEILDRFRERLRPQEIQSPERPQEILDRFRERIRPQEIQSLERPQEILDRFRERIRHEGTERHWRSVRLPPITNIMTVGELRRRRDRFTSETSRNIASQVMVNPVIDPSSSFLFGEASIAPAERDPQLLKVTDSKKEVNDENQELAGKKDGDKGNDDDKGSFFDCNICLDLAKDPVVTCCGHLFCWPCVYQWLIQSVANECPVCKGHLSMKSLTPIYGRGNSPCGPEQDLPGPKIPDRPHARRVESVRQSILRNSVSISMDELVRRLSERTGLVWRDQLANGADVSVAREPLSERILSYFYGERNREEQPPSLDDRGSVSSIAAVIQSESQTIDTVLEIDSNVSLSTSTSRRRNGNEAPRASDVDSGNSRAHQRRRMN